VDVHSAWEQKILEARKMPENGDESHLSSARFVGQCLMGYTLFVIIGDYCISLISDTTTPEIGIIA